MYWPLDPAEVFSLQWKIELWEVFRFSHNLFQLLSWKRPLKLLSLLSLKACNPSASSKALYSFGIKEWEREFLRAKNGVWYSGLQVKIFAFSSFEVCVCCKKWELALCCKPQRYDKERETLTKCTDQHNMSLVGTLSKRNKAYAVVSFIIEKRSKMLWRDAKLLL